MVEAAVAFDAVPVKAPVKVVEVTDVNPAIVVADEPKDIAVEPIVTLLLARFALVIPAVPDKLEFVIPVNPVPAPVIPDVTVKDPDIIVLPFTSSFEFVNVFPIATLPPRCCSARSYRITSK